MKMKNLLILPSILGLGLTENFDLLSDKGYIQMTYFQHKRTTQHDASLSLSKELWSRKLTYWHTTGTSL